MVSIPIHICITQPQWVNSMALAWGMWSVDVDLGWGYCPLWIPWNVEGLFLLMTGQHPWPLPGICLFYIELITFCTNNGAYIEFSCHWCHNYPNLILKLLIMMCNINDLDYHHVLNSIYFHSCWYTLVRPGLHQSQQTHWLVPWKLWPILDLIRFDVAVRWPLYITKYSWIHLYI